jgi:acyl-CoA reductase-like NAD-dependent aldehyde dehydrogenase
MTIQGEMIIGQRIVRGSAGTIRAFNPATQAQLEPEFGLATREDVDAACTLAEQAFDAYRSVPLEQRARFLEAIADRIMDIGPLLIERAGQESGLPAARLEGERGRTVNQLKLFAKVVRDGRFLSATLDSALPQRTPPRPDLRLRNIPLGPVAVFGASNFPLAFSVAGGDTASALAAGCPVVVKAHNAHLGTSELVAKAIHQAARDSGMPEGVFSLLIGEGNQVGQDLVGHPAIKAVGFTGSRGGGLALVGIANARKEPIPVYAEMSSINPFFLLPGALAAGGARLAQGFVDSLTMGVGQFCTNPGLVIALAGADLDAFRSAATEALGLKGAGTMLTAGIHQAYSRAVDGRSGHRRRRAGRPGQCRRPRLRRPRRAVPDRRRHLPRQSGAGRRNLRADLAGRGLPRRGRAAAGGQSRGRPADRDRARECRRPCARRQAAAGPGTQGRAASCSTASRPASKWRTRWCMAGRSRQPRTAVPPPSGRRRSSASCGRSATRMCRWNCCRWSCRMRMRWAWRGWWMGN